MYSCQTLFNLFLDRTISFYLLTFFFLTGLDLTIAPLFRHGFSAWSMIQKQVNGPMGLRSMACLSWLMLPGEHGFSSPLVLPTLGEHGFYSLGSVAPAPHSCEWGCYSPLLWCMVFVTWFQFLREHSFSTFLHAFVDFYIIYNSCSLPLSFVVSPELEAWEHELFLSPFILYKPPFTPFAPLWKLYPFGFHFLK